MIIWQKETFFPKKQSKVRLTIGLKTAEKKEIKSMTDTSGEILSKKATDRKLLKTSPYTLFREHIFLLRNIVPEKHALLSLLQDQKKMTNI